MNSESATRHRSKGSGVSGPDGLAEMILDPDAKQLLERIVGGHSLIVLGWPSAKLAAVLAEGINRRTANGKNVAMLAESEAARDRLREFEGLTPSHEPYGCRRMVRRKFLDALDEPAKKAWFDHLDLVVIPNAEDSLRHPFEWEHLCYRIMDRCARNDCKPPQMVIVCSPRNQAEGALRRNFPIFELNKDLHDGKHVAHEFALAGDPVKKMWWTLWAAEDHYLQQILVARSEVDYGAEGPLAYHVGVRKVSPSHYQPDPATPIEDQLESLQMRLAEIGKRPTWREVALGNPDGAFIRNTPFGGEVLRDPAANPWRTLRALAEKGGEALLVNLVLPQTALRAYLVANPAYFADQALEPLTPRMQRGDFDAMTQLYLRLAAGSELAMAELQRIFNGCTPPIPQTNVDPFLILRERFKRYFGPHIANRLRLTTHVRWQSSSANAAKKTFRRLTSVALQGSGPIVDRVDWLDDVDVVDESNKVQECVRRDHVHQLYVKGQTCVLAGKLFRVESIGDELVLSKATSGYAMYRPSVSVALMAPAERAPLQADLEEGPGFAFRREIYQIAFRVSNECWWSSKDFGRHWRKTSATGAATREYPQGRALRLVLADRNGKPLWSPQQLLALSQWLNESAVTLLPESNRFLIVATHAAEADRPKSEPACDIAPKLTLPKGKIDKLDAGGLWIFEDSHSDLGIVGACYDRAEWLLALCLDYLNWRLDEEGKPEQRSCHLNTERRDTDFLAYGAEKPDPAFDFAGLRDCLDKSGLIDGSMTKARREAQAAAPMVSDDAADPGEAQQCDFCGLKQDGGQGEILKDGRFRCEECRAVGVDTLDEAQAICDEVLELMRTRFCVEFATAIEVSFVAAATIAGALDESFVPTSQFDPRAVGLAAASYSVVYGERFMVFVEHGHSRQSTAMTFAHEFTHIWQYSRLAYQRLAREHGKLLVEGHASWTELAAGRAFAAAASTRDERIAWQAAADKREADLLSRMDEYGVGYRLLLAMGGPDVDGFDLLGAMYPKET